ncbi:MAG: hypothetical protein WC284_17325 [Candidimonas sp.]
MSINLSKMNRLLNMLGPADTKILKMLTIGVAFLMPNRDPSIHGGKYYYQFVSHDGDFIGQESVIDVESILHRLKKHGYGSEIYAEDAQHTDETYVQMITVGFSKTFPAYFCNKLAA